MIYVEKIDNNSMISHVFFMDKVKRLQSLLPIIKSNDLPIKVNSKKICRSCNNSEFYCLSNIIWPNNIEHMINKHNLYPSEYFIKIISNMCIINKTLINPPMIISEIGSQIDFVPFHYNKLLIIDALMHSGSNPIYRNDDNLSNLYSEHSGVISIKNNVIDNIIVSGLTDRLDTNDTNIYLPHDEQQSYEYEYMFHTHPNTNKNLERLKEGIIYEFPSASDIFYFAQCHNKGKSQGSIIVSTEGIYVIRQIECQKMITFNKSTYAQLNKFILDLENDAFLKYKNIIDMSSVQNFSLDIFHENIGLDFEYITRYNDFIKQYNLFIEYYPREKKNDQWYLRSINLMLIK
jgi:hypothetical protein